MNAVLKLEGWNAPISASRSNGTVETTSNLGKCVAWGLLFTRQIWRRLFGSLSCAHFFNVQSQHWNGKNILTKKLKRQFSFETILGPELALSQLREG